jgi:pimeloyl-ACP methyl ester carboxylesterase
MTDFTKRDVVVDGIRVQVLEAGPADGHGEPLVYFHGAGTTSGFQELLPLAGHRRLIIPIHPGFGASQDDAGINSMLDYVVHYNALFDQLGLARPVDIVGHSLGGWIASLFTVLNGHRVRRLALACPAGLRVLEHPTADLFTIRPEQVASRIVSSPEALARMMSAPPTTEFKIARYREMTTLARVIWDRNYDPKLTRWLGRVTTPTLILWGEHDRIIPIEQAKVWAARLVNSEVATFAGAGHLLFFEAPTAVARLGSFFDSDETPRRQAAG